MVWQEVKTQTNKIIKALILLISGEYWEDYVFNFQTMDVKFYFLSKCKKFLRKIAEKLFGYLLLFFVSQDSDNNINFTNQGNEYFRLQIVLLF